MTGKLDRFYIEHGIHGARVMTHSRTISVNCIADGEIDGCIAQLKNDLDACAAEMKRTVKQERRGLFVRPDDVVSG